MAKKSPQGTQTKVETLTIRVSPKMKFGLELLSRKQHRTLTSVAEWALDKALNDKPDGLWHITENLYDGDIYTSILEEVWDPYEPDRMAKLAFKYPYLLTYEEEVMWKLIRENGYLWKGSYISNQWTWVCTEEKLVIERLREYWDEFKQVANGELNPAALPEWNKTKPEYGKKDDVLTEDDIPF